MKRILTLAVLALVAAGCSKENITPEVNVTFNLGNIITGTMTKSAADVLEASAPTGPFSIKLTSTTNSRRVYTITAGEEATIAVDTYRAVCDYTPGGAVDVFRGKIYSEPCFTANGTVEVKTSGTITLAAEYNCWALIIDKTKSSSYQISTAGSPLTISSWCEAGDFGVVYVKPVGWSDTNAAQLVVTPLDDVNFATTSYTLATGTVNGATKVERGKWYVFGPEAVETQSGNIGITLPGWEAGQ